MGKAGIDHVCRLAADELGASGVRVNCIQPGLVDTELVAFVTAGGPVLDSYLENMPIARVGTVDDVAALARFLVGPESTWITGQNPSASTAATPSAPAPTTPRSSNPSTAPKPCAASSTPKSRGSAEAAQGAQAVRSLGRVPPEPRSAAGPGVGPPSEF